MGVMLGLAKIKRHLRDEHRARGADPPRAALARPRRPPRPMLVREMAFDLSKPSISSMHQVAAPASTTQITATIQSR